MSAALQTTAPQIYRTFEDALLACPQGAYEFEDLVNVVVDKTAAFNDRLQTNRVFDLGALRTLIGIGLAHAASTLRVLDFGGAAGYHHSMAQMAFGQRIALQWNVVETPTMARQASRLASGTLKFFDSLAAAKDDLGSVDLLFASSSLQYCPAPLQTLQEFMERRLAPAMNTCVAVMARMESLSQRVTRATQLLSTRIEITREGQNQQLLESMNQRAAAQLRLQGTVEGLSVAAVTYYIVGLIGYLAQGLDGLSFLPSAGVITATSIPVVAILVALGVRRIRRAVERQVDHQMERRS